MLYFLYGEDDVRIGDRRRELIIGFRKKYPTGEVQIFDFEDAGSPENSRLACSSCDQGLFAQPKLVIWLYPFALKEGEDALKSFLTRFVKQDADGISLLIIAPGKIKKTHPIAAFLLKKSQRVEELGSLSGTALEQYALSIVAGFNPKVSIGRPALTVLLKSVGTESFLLKQELSKLAAYRGEGVITSEDVAIFIRSSRETTVFQALDALSQGSPGRALAIFSNEQYRDTASDTVYGLLSMCAWQMRRLIRIREAYDGGIRDSASIARATKLPPFSVQNAFRSISTLSLSRLVAGLTLLADMDAAMKQGKIDPGVALDTFIWKF